MGGRTIVCGVHLKVHGILGWEGRGDNSRKHFGGTDGEKKEVERAAERGVAGRRREEGKGQRHILIFLSVGPFYPSPVVHPGNSTANAGFNRYPIGPQNPGDAHPQIQGDASREVDKVKNVGRSRATQHPLAATYKSRSTCKTIMRGEEPFFPTDAVQSR